MPGPRYTAEEITRLRESPLVQRPDNLPPIEQWIDQPADAARKGRIQGSFQNGKGDENDHPVKRPSPFEARQTSRQSNTGEEIFLGPKISFASASAARQPSKNGAIEAASGPTAQDSKTRPERLGSGERGLKTRNGRAVEVDNQRPRWRQDWKSTQPGDDEREPDQPEQVRNRTFGAGSRWKGTAQDDNGLEADAESANRRGVPERNQDNEGGRGWRGRDWRTERELPRTGRADHDPQWMKEPAGDDNDDHTQEDFQKWKEKMKAGSAAPTDAAVVEATAKPGEHPVNSAPPMPQTMILPMREDGSKENFFGVWGENKDEKKQEKATAAKPRASRFASLFAPPQESSRPAEPASPPPLPNPAQSTTEDQEGFQRMMQMLRMGGNSSQTPASPLFGQPPANNGPEPRREPQQQFEGHQRHASFHPEDTEPPQHNLSSPHKTPSFPPPPIATERLDSHPRLEQGKRDSDFLMGLMGQQRAPFSETQIYGQSYSRGNNNVTSMDNAAIRQQPLKLPFPTAGFMGNDAAFVGNRGMDTSYMHGSTMKSPADRFGPPQNAMSDLHRPSQPMPNFDQPPWQHDRAPSQGQHDGIPPPPGFPSAGRGQAPPGFFSFPAGGMPNNPPQGMRPPPPPMPQQPPGFFGGPNSPPGFPGPAPGMNMPQPRRPSQPPGPPQQMQPGFGGPMHPHPQMQHQQAQPQGQFQQYFKQGGGGMY